MKGVGVMKKLLALVMSLLLLATMIPLGAVSVGAATYDANAAVAYAAAHWNDGVGACATFVSNCLAAGGCDAWSSNVTELRNKLVNGGWGTEYTLTKSGSAIYQSQNEGKLSAGDPIFYYCNQCKKRMHVVICGGFDSAGKATAYAHNVAWNNVNYLGAFEDEYGHTGSDIIAYSFHISGTHNHSYDTYVYYEAAHPHYKCYQCSCGDVAANYSEPTTISGCSSCTSNYEYAMFPMTYLNVTQGVNGSFSHQGTKAIDIAGKDTGIDAAYAPFTGVVKRIYKEYVVWLESSNPVVFADGTIDYMTIMVMHDNDTSDLYVGKEIKQGDHFFDEGTTGYATGNHIHLECGKGKFQGNGWYENSQGNWVIYNSINPYDALYLSSETVIKNDYGYGWKYVTSPNPITYATIDTGTYFIKNKGTGKYLDVDGAIDANKQNIWVYTFNGHDSEKFEITPSTTTAGYMMRPLCSASRVVNAYGNTISSGANVCLWDNVDEYTESQRWNFEAVDGGYVIRNVQAPSCVLTVQSDNNVCVQTYTGADSQIWTLEIVGCDHVYDNDCDAICNNCGDIRTVGAHTYDNGCDMDCNVCGAVRETEHVFNVMIESQPTCNTYGKRRYICDICGYSYEEIITENTSEWSTEYPTGVDEELIESKTEYRYREWIETTEPITENGWILDSTYTRMGEYGAWSNWSNSAITGSENTQVETRTVYPYYYFKCPNCGAHMHVYLGCYTWAGGCGKSGINSGHYVQIDSTVPYSSAGLQEFHGTGRYYTYLDGQLVFQHRDGSKTQYRSRTREVETVYKYYRYTDWSDWSEECNAPNAMAEERTVYRYTIADLADHTYDDEYDADCNVCGAEREVPEKPVDTIYGDANGDGGITILDVILLQQSIAGYDVTLYEAAADANGDGGITILDVILLQQSIAGYDVTLG